MATCGSWITLRASKRNVSSALPPEPPMTPTNKPSQPTQMTEESHMPDTFAHFNNTGDPWSDIFCTPSQANTQSRKRKEYSSAINMVKEIMKITDGLPENRQRVLDGLTEELKRQRSSNTQIQNIQPVLNNTQLSEDNNEETQENRKTPLDPIPLYKRGRTFASCIKSCMESNMNAKTMRSQRGRELERGKRIGKGRGKGVNEGV